MIPGSRLRLDLSTAADPLGIDDLDVVAFEGGDEIVHGIALGVT